MHFFYDKIPLNATNSILQTNKKWFPDYISLFATFLPAGSLLQYSLPGDSDNRGLSQCAPTVAAASIRQGKSMAPNLQLRGANQLSYAASVFHIFGLLGAVFPQLNTKCVLRNPER